MKKQRYINNIQLSQSGSESNHWSRFSHSKSQARKKKKNAE